MKTAISVPDDLFRRVEQRATELGLNRSEFYATAAEHYLRRLDENSLTADIDAALIREGDRTRIEGMEVDAISRKRLAHMTRDDQW